MLFQNLFQGVDLEEIKDSNRGDWTSGSDLQNINQGIRELTGVGYIDLAVKDSSIYTENLELNNLIIYDGGSLDATGYTITVRGDLFIRNGSITCDKLIVWGNIDSKRKIGDISYWNSIEVNEILCIGDMILDYTNWIPTQYYEGVGANPASSIIQKINGNLTITNNNPSEYDWFTSRLHIGGNFYHDGVTISITGSNEKSFLWTIDGNCEFNGLTSLTIQNCYFSPKFSINGNLIFSEANITWDFSGTDGGNAGNLSTSRSGSGGGYIGQLGYLYNQNISSNGQAGQYNGGGSGAETDDIDATPRSGGVGANRGGDGGGCGNNTTGNLGGGGGGGGAPNFTMFYRTGDITTTLNIYLKGGDGGDGNGWSYSTGFADGGDGGDGGVLTLSYDSVPMSVLNMNVAAGLAGAGFNGGSNGVAGSIGSATHTPSGSLLPYHLPNIPTFVTLNNAETSSIEFNVPSDLNNSNLDFEVTIEQRITDTVWLTIYIHNSNSSPSYFSGTPPYTQGAGTVIYTPPVLESGIQYRVSVKAMKDSNTTLSSINSQWLIINYP